MADSRIKLFFRRLINGKNEEIKTTEPEKSLGDNHDINRFKESLIHEQTQHQQEPVPQDNKIYYAIDGQDYSLTPILSFLCMDAEQKGQQPLIPFNRRNDGKYVVSVEHLNSNEKIKLVQKIIGHSLDDIGQVLLSMNEQFSPDHPYSKLCSRAHMMDFVIARKCQDGKTDEAVTQIEQMLKEVLEYDRDRRIENQNTKTDDFCK